LFDETGEPVTLSDNIHIFHGQQNQILDTLFHQTLQNDNSKNPIRNRILLMEIIAQLASDESNENLPKLIAVGMRYMLDHIESPFSVSDLAKHCYVSEVYLRKQFKKHMGMSPSKYHNILRLERACSYLKYGDIYIQEISDTLGYTTVSHFIKQFKETYGVSPLQYRKKGR